MIRIQVDARAIEVESGANLLAACLAHGIYIPHLCFLGDASPAAGACRLCFVEIAGSEKPVPACTVAVDRPLAVATATPAVRRLQIAGLKLLLSAHRVACRGCPANRRCALQGIARHLRTGLNPAPFERLLKEPDVDASHPCLDYHPNRCVLCGKCVQVCRDAQGQTALTFARRGFETVVSHFALPGSAAAPCGDCRACTEVCPVAALRWRG
jgi:NADH dehydrogenase/NADH:ubiquinone oxidoreductase subunit G